MIYYKRIPFWINRSRINFLRDFRDFVETYFYNSKADRTGDGRIEEQTAKEARVKINRNMDEVYQVIVLCGVNPRLTYTPPPAIGGYAQNIDVIHNIFNLNHFSIPPDPIFDFIDRAIGIYEKNHSKSIVRTFNPFFWISELLIYVARLPFKLKGRLGFDQEKAEQSLIGRILKGILYIVTLLASLLTVLHLLDLLTYVRNILKNIFAV